MICGRQMSAMATEWPGVMELADADTHTRRLRMPSANTQRRALLSYVCDSARWKNNKTNSKGQSNACTIMFFP